MFSYLQLYTTYACCWKRRPYMYVRLDHTCTYACVHYIYTIWMKMVYEKLFLRIKPT